ncbi:hypothetical protein [Halomarina oriensis]|uniref:Uncharacterized protein n=1 Tax=Halomarina oriensis TaxID=671145 RepID=A0A6B0GT25_9EURY|nr:hypothetical protein [Halomarina oriensis]MWG36507.1 hypothetical protein [Halomarina oriensis]
MNGAEDTETTSRTPEEYVALGEGVVTTEIGGEFCPMDVEGDFEYKPGVLSPVMRYTFGDTWGEKAIEFVYDGEVRETYALLNNAPIELWPDYEDVPVGMRYNYQFIDHLADCDIVRVVAWDAERYPTEENVFFP